VSQDEEEEDPWEGMEPWERAACDPDYAAALGLDLAQREAEKQRKYGAVEAIVVEVATH
jgi:hypothetical protein